MSLLPELDRRKTVENVRYLFEKELPRLENMARVSLGSPAISDMPSSSSASNSNDNKYVDAIWARNIIVNIQAACEYMPEPYRTTLKLRYFHKLTWTEIEERMYISERAGQKRIEKAFMFFAESFYATDDLRVSK
ncbi:ArpU family phage packaging/lysis transcriptional regulator [Weissella tructae]|uniref:ArpU family phage packaging/lysis transcriptional regulator n=1 Tax=Weissella tructae TaxID=887702 RepID=UPI003D8A7432